MREALEVNREGMIPLRSVPELDSTALDFLFGAMAHVLVCLLISYFDY